MNEIDTFALAKYMEILAFQSDCPVDAEQLRDAATRLRQLQQQVDENEGKPE